jgi:hypothetical protein
LSTLIIGVQLFLFEHTGNSDTVADGSRRVSEVAAHAAVILGASARTSCAGCELVAYGLLHATACTQE